VRESEKNSTKGGCWEGGGFWKIVENGGERRNIPREPNYAENHVLARGWKRAGSKPSGSFGKLVGGGRFGWGIVVGRNRGGGRGARVRVFQSGCKDKPEKIVIEVA